MNDLRVKNRIAAGLMVCMLLFSVCYGAVKGWRGERQEAENAAATLENAILSRTETACNFLTVAERHMPTADATFRKVRDDIDILRGNGKMRQRAQANRALDGDCGNLLELLSALETVQKDALDSMYVKDYLPQMLQDSGIETEIQKYNESTSKYNQAMNRSFSGAIAKLFGVGNFELFKP